MIPSIKNNDIIMSNRMIFNKIVYTPLSKAIKILEKRKKDKKLVAKIEKLLNGDIPKIFKDNKCGIMARQIATPNHDIRSFISIAIDNYLKPVFYEYTNDKFVPDNDFKHSLGQLIIHGKIDKNGNFIEEKNTIINFNKYNGKKLKEIKTLWGESLVDFHKKLFIGYNIDLNTICFLDQSKWVSKNGKKACDFYSNLFLFFICHGILFENFKITDSEGIFTKEVILPALEKVFKITGLKPIIVPIPPMDIEDDVHWLSHEKVVKKFIIKK